MSGPSRRRPERFGDLRRDTEQIAAEVDEELAHHLELRAARLIEQGMPPDQARQEARRRFGAISDVRGACLDLQARRDERVWRRELWGDFLRDLRHAARRLRREPGFALSAIGILGLGLGALLATLALVDAVMLRPLPYPDSDRLVAVWPELRSRAELDAVEQLSSLAEVGGYRDGLQLALPTADGAQRIEAAEVTPELFRAFGQPPLTGRTLGDGDEGAAVPRAMLGEHLWRRVWGADPEVVGSVIQLDGRGWEVVGVMPAGFRFPRADTELWTTLDRDGANLGAHWGNYEVRLVGRLAADASSRDVARDLRALAARLRSENPVWTPAEDYGRDAVAPPLQQHLAGSDLRRTLIVLVAAVTALLLVVCVNVAGLLLARAGARGDEAAVRASLGASRGRLIRQHLVEALALAIGGTALGLVLSQALVRALAAGLEGVDARFGAVGIDLRLTAVAVMMVAITAGAIGLWPALRISRAPGGRLAGRGRSTPGDGVAGRRVLVAGQLAVCVLLVSAASLLLVSLRNLSRVALGFDGQAVVAARVDPPSEPYLDPARSRDLYARVIERLAALPGASVAAVADRLPLDGGQLHMAFPASGMPPRDDGTLPMAVRRVVSDGYFAALGIPLLEGRVFDRGDRTDGAPVVVVNRTLAETFWPNASAVGERVGMPWDRTPGIRIVGVVEDTVQERIGAEVEPEIYFPLSQMPTLGVTVLLRADGDPRRLDAPLRAAVAAVDPHVPVSEVGTVGAIRLDAMAGERHLALTVGALALQALLIAALGVFGVVAYLVESRRRELGVRVALGASRGSVARMVLEEALRLGTVGVGLGLAATLLFGRALRSLLFEASPLDPRVLLTVALGLLAVCALAAWLPARRAARLDPVAALRAE